MEEITKKGAWSPEEDQKLKAYIMRYGIWNWNLMSKFAGLSRTGKSCRLRWMNYLHPDVKRGPFTVEEIETVIKMYQDLGNRWAAIATRLPGRTDNEVKNFFHTHLKRHLGVKNIDAPMKSKIRSTKSKEIKRANGSSKAQEKPVLFPTMIGTSRNKSSLMLSHDISSNPATHHQSADSLRIESLDKFDTSSFWLHLLNDAHRLIL